ncbi:IQ motif and SEC7 domain-containing protein 1 isoform X2 [Nematostella vectensis]|uniref:IQ motif and SEC7 domain-containing protein 1 isoform X2 n=1 Tax=Nematostella vectensis TaxID=45351 RepID=UPI0020777BE6|nr:IQ motif and SEC7 domain-containing protein 1 isoform X2 [Nematostella vectensis]
MASQDATREALGLIENLKICILKQDQIIRAKNSEIKSLNSAVASLEEERRKLKQELAKLKGETSSVVSDDDEKSNDHVRTPPKDGSSFKTPPTSPSILITSEKGGQNALLASIKSTPTLSRRESGKGSLKRGSDVSRSQSFKKYELSSDLMDRTIQVLERKYGGKEKAHDSAKVIQSYWRQYSMNKRFRRLRTYSETPIKTGAWVKSHSDPPIVNDTVVQRTPVLRIKTAHVTDKDNRVRSVLIIDNISQAPDTPATLKSSSDSVVNSVGSVGLVAEGALVQEERIPFEEDDEKSSEKFQETEHYLKVEMKADESIVNSPSGSFDSDTHMNGDVQRGRGHLDESDDSAGEDYHPPMDAVSLDSADGICLSSEKAIAQDAVSISSEFDPVPAADLKPQKLEMRIGINQFNRKPEKGVTYLIAHQVIDDNPEAVAKFLLSEHGVSKQRLGEYLGNLQNDFNMAVLKCFAESFDFTGMEIDVALRTFLAQFRIPGEAQKIERLMEVFAEQYISCNPTDDTSAQDKVLILAFAIVMLNTDLHSPNVKKRMTEEDFIRNLEGTNNGGNFPSESLAGIYRRVFKKEFTPARDHVTMTAKLEKKIVGKMPWTTLAALHRYLRMLTPLFEIRDPNKKEKTHPRVIFVFNDMIVVTKERGRPGQRDGYHFYSYKHSFLLSGVKISVFTNDYYPWGIQLYSRLQSQVVATFNATDERTRKVFVEELLECIEETNAMENDRIATEKQRYMAGGKFIRTPGTMTLPHPKKSRGTSQPNPDAISLLEGTFTNSLGTDSLVNSKHLSNSMLNISDADTSFSSEGGSFKRCNSSSSLDSAFVDGAEPEPANTKKKPAKKPSKEDPKLKTQKSWLFRTARY